VAAPEKLTKNQAAVLDVLSHERAPLSAYDILDRVREQGLRSPLQVYRALKPLVERGHVHRLESLSAFVACAHLHEAAHDDAHGPTVFAICERCGRVDEFTDGAIAGRLEDWAGRHGFRTASTTVEMRGACRDCAAAA
jgi:Fur family transcriptional regulator, zinc uptake regulator